MIASSNPTQADPRTMQGLTLVELMVTVAILGILAAIAAPSLLRQIERARLESAAEGIYQIFRQARVATTRYSRDVYVMLDKGTNWNVWISPEPTCAHRAPASPCLLNNMKLAAADHPGVSVETLPTSLETITVDFRTGRYVNTSDPASGATLRTTVTSTSGMQLAIEAGPSGQLRLCDPNGTAYTRYPSC